MAFVFGLFVDLIVVYLFLPEGGGFYGDISIFSNHYFLTVIVAIPLLWGLLGVFRLDAMLRSTEKFCNVFLGTDKGSNNW